MIEASVEFPIISDLPDKVDSQQIPTVTGELGSRWNQLFGGDNKKVVNQADLLGLVETGRDYWREIENNPQLLRPFWPKQTVKGEAEWWGKAAECLRTGEGDIQSIDHIRQFIEEKVKQEQGKKMDESVEQRLREIVTWLVGFQNNPQALPSWQKVDRGTPVLKYPKE